jgi:hypothetical protein
MSGDALPKVTPAGLSKGDRANVRRFKSADDKRLRSPRESPEVRF